LTSLDASVRTQEILRGKRGARVNQLVKCSALDIIKYQGHFSDFKGQNMDEQRSLVKTSYSADFISGLKKFCDFGTHTQMETVAGYHILLMNFGHPVKDRHTVYTRLAIGPVLNRNYLRFLSND